MAQQLILIVVLIENYYSNSRVFLYPFMHRKYLSDNFLSQQSTPNLSALEKSIHSRGKIYTRVSNRTIWRWKDLGKKKEK
jgi:hypothetical protein